MITPPKYVPISTVFNEARKQLEPWMAGYFTHQASNDRDLHARLASASAPDIYYFAMAKFVKDGLYAHKPFEGLAKVHSTHLLQTTFRVEGLGYPGAVAQKRRLFFTEDIISRFSIGGLPQKFYDVENWTNMLGVERAYGEFSDDMNEALLQNIQTSEFLHVPKFISMPFSQLNLSLYEAIETTKGTIPLGWRNTTFERRLADQFRQLDKCYLCVEAGLADDAANFFDKNRDQILGSHKAEQAKMLGRPSKKIRGALIYKEIYPNGHEAVGHVQKQVAHAVSEASEKETFSYKTIERGLLELKNQTDYTKR